MKKRLTKPFNSIQGLVLFTILFSLPCMAKEDNELLKKVFPHFSNVRKIPIKDSVSKEMNNNELMVFYKGDDVLGFARSINTTTGCQSECLPIVYTTFFNAKGEYIKLISPTGLTKIFHAEFSAEDYSRLDFLLLMSPKVFDKVIHPKEMTDAISGETLKDFKESVVEGAAYSTLRIHLYHQETIRYIKDYLKKKN